MTRWSTLCYASREVGGLGGQGAESCGRPHTRVPRPVRESIRFRLRPSVWQRTLISPCARTRMPRLKNPPVCRSPTYQIVIIYLIGTFPCDANDKSPLARRPIPAKSKRYQLLHSLCSCSHTFCQDICLASQNCPLGKSRQMCYHARVCVHGRYVGMGAYARIWSPTLCKPR